MTWAPHARFVGFPNDRQYYGEAWIRYGLSLGLLSEFFLLVGLHDEWWRYVPYVIDLNVKNESRNYQRDRPTDS